MTYCGTRYVCCTVEHNDVDVDTVGTVYRVCMYVGRRKGEGMRGDNTTIGPSHGNLRPDGRRSWHALYPDIFSRPCKTITREQTSLVSHLSPSRIGPCCDLFVHRMEKRGGGSKRKVGLYGVM